MIARPRYGLVLALFLTVAPSARAADETAVVNRATKLLEEISSKPDSGIPPQYLREARAIMIMPGMVETELGVGRKRGRGVFLSRKENGEWANPEPVEISGLSVGAEAGLRVSDVLTIYRTQKAVAEDIGFSLSLGAEFRASGSLKQRDRFSGWTFHGFGPDSMTKNEILHYTRYRGILVGGAIHGEHRQGPHQAQADSTAQRTAERKAADGKAGVKVSAAASPAKFSPAKDSPEVARLKTVLAAMTTPPPTPAAEMRTKDAQVRTAAGPKPSAGTAAPPR